MSCTAIVAHDSSVAIDGGTSLRGVREGKEKNGRNAMPRRRSSDKDDRGPSQRQLRVGEEIRHLLAELLERGNMRDPDLRGASITVTAVDVSPDLRNAIAFVMPLGGADEARMLGALKRAAPWFRARVGEKAGLRYAPEIRFHLDRTFDEADKIGALLRRPDVARDIEDE
jgi:ribosome-binding factor A